MPKKIKIFFWLYINSFKLLWSIKLEIFSLFILQDIFISLHEILLKKLIGKAMFLWRKGTAAPRHYLGILHRKGTKWIFLFCMVQSALQQSKIVCQLRSLILRIWKWRPIKNPMEAKLPTSLFWSHVDNV